MSVCMCVFDTLDLSLQCAACRSMSRPENGIKYPVAGVTDSFELPN